MGERPKWGINRPKVQYLKQSEKDPHYLRRMKRRARRTKEAATGVDEKLLQSDMRLLSFQTDEEEEKKEFNLKGFRMVSNPSSPRFVPICGNNSQEEVEEIFQMIVNEKTSEDEVKVEDVDEESEACVQVSEEIDSLPSTGRSEEKSNDGYADNDDSEEETKKQDSSDAIIQIEALKIVSNL